MFETLSVLPISFWAVVALLISGGIWSFRRMNDGTGIPSLAVLGTVAAWYIGDAFYNDYANNHAKLFDAAILAGAWWQVAWFLLIFLLVVPPVHRWMNRNYQGKRSGVLQLFNHGVNQPVIQKQLNAVFSIGVVVWGGLLMIAFLALKMEVVHYIFPFWGYKASPWAHGRVGAGFDFLSVIAIYLNLLVAMIFGVVAALATTPRIRFYAILLCFLTWPYWVLDRTRNVMLALVIPAILSWVLLRLRGSIWKKVVLLFMCYLAVNIWMKFVIANRTDMNIATAFKQKGLNLSAEEKVHNEGLNMFEELCWISTFIDNGSYRVNWGRNYFAELVNPIPRALWPGKPLIALDYAKARGHAQADDTEGGVNTTISTGLIGQGVVNFGRILGPMAAAFLMSLWVAWLARLDVTVHKLGHLPLYSLGLILTFNMGRDVTLIILYPFVFGILAVWWFGRHHPQSDVAPAHSATVSNVVRPSSLKVAGPERRPLFFRRATGGFARRRHSATTAKF